MELVELEESHEELGGCHRGPEERFKSEEKKSPGIHPHFFLSSVCPQLSHLLLLDILDDLRPAASPRVKLEGGKVRVGK